MSRKLVVVAGPESGKSIALDGQIQQKIGRGQASDTQLNDPRMSRVHCTIQSQGDSLILADAGSTGGTFVAGQRIQKHRLSDGDEIQIGDSRLQYHSGKMPKKSVGKGSSKPPKLSAKSLDDLVGQTLGDFKLEKLHHTGSASVLFQASDVKHSRGAMVKVMLPSVTSDEEQRTRFVRAVHTMINVRHDNLVEVYGAGKQGPFCWCAMEFIDGISILEIIELIGSQGRLDWREVYRVGVHVARALECAHRHKVIHRNVTPDNLLQRKNDKVVKLCDLMLAKALEGTQARQVTAPGQLVGNVSYMSPERMVDTANLDWRSDQYGLGATLFALLTGYPPFQAKSLPELVKAVRTVAPAFPDDVKQETIPAFRQLILKMLSKTPEERYTYPSELLRALDEIGKDNSVDADVLFNQ